MTTSRSLLTRVREFLARAQEFEPLGDGVCSRSHGARSSHKKELTQNVRLQRYG